MGCYHGYHSGRGAEGVGRATTNAVVSASILILISNYLVTALFLGCNMTATPKIELRDVTKTFGDNAVLKGIDLQVAAGIAGHYWHLWMRQISHIEMFKRLDHARWRQYKN